MRKKFVFATNNSHKLEEVTAILGEKVELLSMKDIKCDTDIPETADTLEGNALLKARYIFDNYHLDCFADDTGLEVEALGGAPGVYSARYLWLNTIAPAGISLNSAPLSPTVYHLPVRGSTTISRPSSPTSVRPPGAVPQSPPTLAVPPA